MATKHIIQKLCENTDLNVRSYSGRAMYGRQCLAITCEGAGQFINQLLHSAVDEGLDTEDLREIADACATLREDSMGLDRVIYFPVIEFCDSDDEGDDEEEEEELDTVD